MLITVYLTNQKPSFYGNSCAPFRVKDFVDLWCRCRSLGKVCFFLLAQVYIWLLTPVYFGDLLGLFIILHWLVYGGLICAKFVFDAVMQSLRLLVCMRFIGRYLVWEKGRQGRFLHILINYWLQRKYLFKITRPVRATLRMLYWPMCNAVQLYYVCMCCDNQYTKMHIHSAC